MNLSITRRNLLRGAATAGVGIAAAPYILRSARAQNHSLVFVTWGGTYADSIKKAFLDPFTKDTGIPVTVASGADIARVRVQVSTKNYDWDIFDGTGPMATSGEREHLWEPINKAVVDTSSLIHGAAREGALGFYLYAGGVGFDPQRFPDGKHPVDFPGLWDAKRFPGRRGLRTRISETLEIALMADGVEPAKLYPLDVERGFKALDRIKPHVVKWIAETPQTVSLIQNNEVDFDYIYSGRVVTAQRSGISIGFSYEQTLNSMGYLSVLKGSPNRDSAMRLLSYFTKPDRQAAFTELMTYSPTNMKAMELVTPATKKLLPDLTSPKNAIVNDDWWADKFVKLQKRFQEWMIS